MKSSLNPSTAVSAAPATGGLDAAKERGQRHWHDRTRDGTLLTAEHFAKVRGDSGPEDLADEVARGELTSYYIEDQYWYPAELLKIGHIASAAVCLALGDEEPASVFVFIHRRHGALEGRTVAEAIAHAVPLERVLELARAWRDR